MDTVKHPIIELREIQKHFEGFHLNGINLEIYSGEVHILVGENGSGKSTIMKLLSGWFPPEEGTILYKGKSVKFQTIYKTFRNGILYLHQDVQIFNNLTVAENVYFGNLPCLWGIKSLYNRNLTILNCTKVFRKLGITINPETLLKNLGYAEQQLISAVRGYISNAEVIIFDEPSSAMTEPDRIILFNIISNLKARGKAIFYISHRMDEIHKIGDRVSVLHKGHIIESRPCNEVDREKLVQMMTGDVHKERYPRFASERGSVVMKVKGITKKPSIKGINLDLYKGEILGITGLMGSGRTLLANCLFGVIKPDKGEIYINGEKVSFNHPKEAMAKGISLIPEDRIDNGIFPQQNLVNNMTIATLKRFQAKLSLNDQFMKELSRYFINALSIYPGGTKDILENYSGGNQQKVLIARWLMNQSKIYIMDEPTRGIDVAAKVDIYNTINDMVEKGASIILISSEIEEILGMSDRIIVLTNGRISGQMTRKEATKEKILKYATTGES